ncbi:MAG: tyrosine-type recombinase/integrase [Blastocatellia bacterium]
MIDMSNSLLPQKAPRNNSDAIISFPSDFSDSLDWWAEKYLRFEVTTANSSRKVQQRDLQLFLDFVQQEEKTLKRTSWSPRLSRDFQDTLRRELISDSRKRSDRTINRIMAHLKTFAKWIHKLKPFPLGNPMEKVRLAPVGTGLEIERAITPAERRKILDAADLLLQIGGMSKDRNRYRGDERPKRKGYRAYRNRAIIYTLIETGMRRAAIRNLNLKDVNFKSQTISVKEKGGTVHSYHISREGLRSIQDYLDNEYLGDNAQWKSTALFLSPSTTPHGDGRLNLSVINRIWNETCAMAGVEDRTPHSARHAMGKHIIEKTGNIAAVQRQLGHRNAAYSMQYARITADELRAVIEDR